MNGEEQGSEQENEARREKVRALVRLVLEELGSSRGQDIAPVGLASLAKTVKEQWFLSTVGAALASALVGWWWFDIALLQPFEELQFKQEQYRKDRLDKKVVQAIVEQHVEVGNLLFENLQLPLAAMEFEAALSLEPASSAAQLGVQKARLLNLSRSDAESESVGTILLRIEALQRVCDANCGVAPERTRAHLHLLRGLLAQDLRPAEAKGHLEQSLRLLFEQPGAHAVLASILVAEEDLDRALSHYELAATFSPSMTSLGTDGAGLHMLRGDPEAAIALLKDTPILQEGELSTVAFSVAQAYLMVGDFAAAEQSFDVARDASVVGVWKVWVDQRPCPTGRPLPDNGAVDAVANLDGVDAPTPRGISVRRIESVQAIEALVLMEFALASWLHNGKVLSATLLAPVSTLSGGYDTNAALDVFCGDVDRLIDRGHLDAAGWLRFLRDVQPETGKTIPYVQRYCESQFTPCDLGTCAQPAVPSGS